MDPAILNHRTAAINSSRGILVAARGATLDFAATNLMDTAAGYLLLSTQQLLHRHLVMRLRKYVMFATTFFCLVLGVYIEEL